MILTITVVMMMVVLVVVVVVVMMMMMMRPNKQTKRRNSLRQHVYLADIKNELKKQQNESIFLSIDIMCRIVNYSKLKKMMISHPVPTRLGIEVIVMIQIC